jgi:hypothetical protein
MRKESAKEGYREKEEREREREDVMKCRVDWARTSSRLYSCN